ncbi:MAG: LysR family transcriptional regulator [Deltaproteobacteria bacterium]|nr:LysR family transcriptional regulator [Deltaproteobacteria bacterium]
MQRSILAWLDALIAVCDHEGKQSAAASQLDVARRTINNHVNNLERALGVELFDKASKRPTAAALALVDWARRANLELQDEIRRIQHTTVRVAMTSHISRNYLEAILQRFWAGKSDCQRESVVALDRRADDVTRHVLDGRADIGVGPLPARPDERREIDATIVFPSKLTFIASPGRMKGTHPTWKWSLGQPWVVHEERTATRTLFDDLVEDQRRNDPDLPHQNIVVEATDVMLLIDYVRADFGISFIARGPVIDRAIDDLAVFDLPQISRSGAGGLDPAHGLGVGVFWRRRGPGDALPAHIRRFVKAAEEEIGKFLGQGRPLQLASEETSPASSRRPSAL